MTDLDERILDTKPLYEGKLVKLYLETVRLPDGTTAPREVVRHPGAVAMVPLLANGDVVLVRQYRVAAGRVMLEIPAGTLNPGEEPLEAAARELQEEAGQKPGKLVRLGGEFTAPGYTSEFIHLFLATDLEESRLEEDADEFLENVTMPLPDAVQMVLAGTIQDGKTIAGLLLAAQYLHDHAT